jgi:hypothetical protein
MLLAQADAVRARAIQVFVFVGAIFVNAAPACAPGVAAGTAFPANVLITAIHTIRAGYRRYGGEKFHRTRSHPVHEARDFKRRLVISY